MEVSVTTTTVLAIIIAALAVAVIILAVALSAVRRDISAQRVEMYQTLQSEFSEMNRGLSDRAQEEDRRMEYLRATVENRLNALQTSNAAELEKIRASVDEKLQNSLDERLARSFAQVRGSLDQVYRGLGEMQGLAQDVGDLRKLMTNVKSRGVIGEMQLGAILEQILAPAQYEANAQVKPNTQERVEYAVKLPGNGGGTVYLPIDSKFPGDIYGALQDAYDNADAVFAETQRKRLAQFIRQSAKEIRDKYVEPPYTTDFGVMFLPFEGLYAEVVNMELMEICQKEYRIMIAGPSTLAALLNSLQMGFRTLAIQKRSTEVWGVLGQVKGEFDKFADVLASAQQRINQANAELDKLIGVRTRSIQKTLSGIQDLGDPGDREGSETP
ncbi:MAG: DNA recombination protein RmuC, partial [Firmicutes bacterium]|nr:DNA recombination protein RmuC [Bacillota bacterium]